MINLYESQDKKKETTSTTNKAYNFITTSNIEYEETKNEAFIYQQVQTQYESSKINTEIINKQNKNQSEILEEKQKPEILMQNKPILPLTINELEQIGVSQSYSRQETPKFIHEYSKTIPKASTFQKEPTYSLVLDEEQEFKQKAKNATITGVTKKKKIIEKTSFENISIKSGSQKQPHKSSSVKKNTENKFSSETIIDDRLLPVSIADCEMQQLLESNLQQGMKISDDFYNQFGDKGKKIKSYVQKRVDEIINMTNKFKVPKLQVLFDKIHHLYSILDDKQIFIEKLEKELKEKLIFENILKEKIDCLQNETQTVRIHAENKNSLLFERNNRSKINDSQEKTKLIALESEFNIAKPTIDEMQERMQDFETKEQNHKSEIEKFIGRIEKMSLQNQNTLKESTNSLFFKNEEIKSMGVKIEKLSKEIEEKDEKLKAFDAVFKTLGKKMKSSKKESDFITNEFRKDLSNVHSLKSLGNFKMLDEFFSKKELSRKSLKNVNLSEINLINFEGDQKVNFVRKIDKIEKDKQNSLEFHQKEMALNASTKVGQISMDRVRNELATTQEKMALLEFNLNTCKNENVTTKKQEESLIQQNLELNQKLKNIDISIIFFEKDVLNFFESKFCESEISEINLSKTGFEKIFDIIVHFFNKIQNSQRKCLKDNSVQCEKISNKYKVSNKDTKLILNQKNHQPNLVQKPSKALTMDDISFKVVNSLTESMFIQRENASISQSNSLIVQTEPLSKFFVKNSAQNNDFPDLISPIYAPSSLRKNRFEDENLTTQIEKLGSIQEEEEETEDYRQRYFEQMDLYTQLSEKFFSMQSQFSIVSEKASKYKTKAIRFRDRYDRSVKELKELRQYKYETNLEKNTKNEDSRNLFYDDFKKHDKNEEENVEKLKSEIERLKSENYYINQTFQTYQKRAEHNRLILLKEIEGIAFLKEQFQMSFLKVK